RRGGDRARNPGARHSRQRVVPPLGRGPRVAEGPSRLDVSLHAGPGVVDERRRGVLLEAGAAAAPPQRRGRAAVPVEPRSPEDLVESWKRGHRRLQKMELNELDNALARAGLIWLS
ncbi:MAG: hypothetical protein OXE85_14065, partial [Roseovarius sp.]|nr:hypothetical protein [Roseovarius sp.]